MTTFTGEHIDGPNGTKIPIVVCGECDGSGLKQAPFGGWVPGVDCPRCCGAGRYGRPDLAVVLVNKVTSNAAEVFKGAAE